MAIKVEPPMGAKETVVANVSTTTRYPVERASNAQPAPRTRPAPINRPPNPTVVAKPQVLTGVSPMRAALEAELRRKREGQPQRPRPTVIGAAPSAAQRSEEDRREGVGRGSPPPGGIKMR
jgi:hypothetical protein